MAWNCKTLTITSGGAGAIRLAAIPTPANRLIITPLAAASGGLIYVLNQYLGEPVTVMTKAANTFVTEIGPATATDPGLPFYIERYPGGPPIQVEEFGIDGAHTGDTVQVAWDPAG